MGSKETGISSQKANGMENWAVVSKQSIAQVLQRLVEYLPNILGFVALLAAGVLLAWLVSRLSHRLITRILERVSRVRHLETGFHDSIFFRSMPTFVSRFICWTVFLVFLGASVEALGISAVSSVLGWLTVYLPRLLAAVLIIIGGIWGGEILGTFLSRAGTQAGVTGSDLLGRLAKTLLILLSVTISIETLGIDNTVLLITLSIAFGVSFAAVGLAFGLGAKTTAGNIIAAHYVRKTFRPGDRVRIGNREGAVVEITPISVVIETPEGRVNIPADLFNRESAVLLREPS